MKHFKLTFTLVSALTFIIFFSNQSIFGQSPVPANGKIVFASTLAGNREIYTIAPDGTLKRLTNIPASDLDCAWSPNAAKVVFASQRDGNREIYVMNADGSNQTRLTNNPAFDGQPFFSPDGKKIAFVSDRDTGSFIFDIYVMNSDGTNVVRLTINSNADVQPAWSPDGSKILFVSDRAGNNNVYVMDAATGNNVQRLTLNSAANFDPSWSTDNSKIVFRSDQDGNFEVYVMDAAGNNLQRLTNNSSNEFQPVFAPDGAKISFISNRDGSNEVYAMDSDGNNQTRITNTGGADNIHPGWQPLKANGPIGFGSDRNGGDEVFRANPSGSALTQLTTGMAPAESPIYSSDGRKMAFESYVTGSGEIYTMNADGTGITQLTTSPAVTESQPAFSPDGTRIVFVRTVDADGDNNIYIMNADGSGLTPLATEATREIQPAWSPDGSRIMYIRGFGNAAEIYVRNADGSGVPTNLTNNAVNDLDPAWSPDGTQIVFRSVRDADGDREIYLMNANGTGTVQLTQNATAFDSQPTFSPDGSRITFTSDRDGNFEIYVMNVDGSNQTRLTAPAPGTTNFHASWQPLQPTATATGTNVSVQSGDVNITFAAVSAAGQTSAAPIAPSAAGPLPAGFVIDGSSVAFEISTTASVTPPINVCFNLPSVNDSQTFAALRVLHRETGVLVDRTISSDFGTRTICAQTNSLSPFLIATSTDHTAPVTTATLVGVTGSNGWYRSDVSVTLTAADNSGGVGVKQITYSVNGSAPTVISGASAAFLISTEGMSTITFYATDNVGNVESPKSVTLKMDKTAPTAALSANPSRIWPANGKIVNVILTGTGTDGVSGLAGVSYLVSDEYGSLLAIAPRALAGNTSSWTENLSVEARRNGSDQDGRLYRVTATLTDQAGNTATTFADIVVPHDQGN